MINGVNEDVEDDLLLDSNVFEMMLNLNYSEIIMSYQRQHSQTFINLKGKKNRIF